MSTNRSTLTLAPENESSSSYRDQLCLAMSFLAEDERVVFIGQGVQDKGTFMSTTLRHLPMEKRIELPVAEEMQAGMCIGLALAGYVPVCIYPRWNFLILATNQFVNHLDKMEAHVIVRVGIGSTNPLDPGPQHKGDFTDAFKILMPNTPIVKLDHVDTIAEGYRFALLENEGPTVLVEVADLYES